MKRKFVVLLMLLLSCLVLVNAAMAAEVKLDYENETVFEAALNKGEDVVGKIVRFKVLSVHPDSIEGVNVWAGDHLNFISEGKPDVKDGENMTVKIDEVQKKYGSWFLKYTIINEQDGSSVAVKPVKNYDAWPKFVSQRLDLLMLNLVYDSPFILGVTSSYDPDVCASEYILADGAGKMIFEYVKNDENEFILTGITYYAECSQRNSKEVISGLISCAAIAKVLDYSSANVMNGSFDQAANKFLDRVEKNSVVRYGNTVVRCDVVNFAGTECMIAVFENLNIPVK